jgi:hypothetical protein
MMNFLINSIGCVIWAGVGWLIIHFFDTRTSIGMICAFLWVMVPTAIALWSWSKTELVSKQKVLWIIVILLIPIFGPMAWFTQKERNGG